MKTVTEYTWDMADTIDREVRRWFKDACKDLRTRYLYFIPNGLDMRLSCEIPGDGWELATGRPVPPSWSMDECRSFMWETFRRLPILPV